MIEILDESADNVLAVRAAGTLTSSDYREVLMPRIAGLRREFGPLRVLFVLDREFRGWTAGAAWANTVLDIRHHRDFAKVAMVGAPAWEDRCIRATATLLMRGRLRSYRSDQLAEARRWLRD